MTGKLRKKFVKCNTSNEIIRLFDNDKIYSPSWRVMIYVLLHLYPKKLAENKYNDYSVD